MLVDILSSPLSKISETSIEIEAVSLLRNFFGTCTEIVLNIFLRTAMLFLAKIKICFKTVIDLRSFQIQNRIMKYGVLSPDIFACTTQVILFTELAQWVDLASKL